MDEGERKEEPSVPPDYVSLAQLQERWLQKQEEKKLKEREEEERKLKEKEEEDRKRERDARAQKGKNLNWRGMKNDGRAKIEGGFVRDKGLIEDRGKGKVMAVDGPENREEINSRRGGSRGSRRGGFQKVAAVEEKVEVGVAGGAGVSREEGGGGGGGVVEICSVCVAEVLPVNGVEEEVRDVNRTNLRGGLRGNGRRVDELEQSEMALGFERKVEGGRNHGENWRGRGRGGRIWGERNGGNQRRLNLLEEFRPVVSEKKGEDEVSGVCHEISSLSIGDRNGIRNSKSSNKAGEDRVEGECSAGGETEKKADHEGARIGGNKANLKGYQRKENRRKDLGQERRYTRSGISAEEDRIEEEVSNGNKVVMEIEKKVDLEVLPGESEKRGEKKGGVKGNRKSKNRKRDFGQERGNTKLEISAEVDSIQEEGSNGSKLAVEIEKKVDPEVLDGESSILGEKKGVVKPHRKKKKRNFGRERRNTRLEISAEEGRVEEEGSNGNEVVVENEKKVEHEVLNEENETLGEKKGTVTVYRRIENQRRDFGQERRHPRLENKGIVNGYQRTGYRREGFGRERRQTRRGEVNSGENGMVWVKKEEKFGA